MSAFMLDVKQIAERMGVAPRTVRDLFATGELRGHRIRTKWVATPAQVQQFLDAHPSYEEPVRLTRGRAS